MGAKHTEDGRREEGNKGEVGGSLADRCRVSSAALVYRPRRKPFGRILARFGTHSGSGGGGPSSNLCKHLLCLSRLPKHPPKSSLCPRDVTGWLAHCKQTAAVPLQWEERWMWVWTEGWSGKWGGRRGGRERERGKGKKVGEAGGQEPESESCHKTTIIRSLSATQ